MIVLDASLMIAWLMGERPVPAQSLLDTLPDVPIVVPSHWPLEMANALSTYMRAGRLRASDLLNFIVELDGFEIVVESPLSVDEIAAVANFALAHKLTSYDAVYLQLALRRGAILGTVDQAMRAAAQRLNVAVLPA